MPQTVAVLDIAEVADRAYEAGYREFESFPHDEREVVDVAAFRGTARWANHIAPRLRALAGAEDSGVGTHTRHRDAVLVAPEDIDDIPSEGSVVDTEQVYRRLITAFDFGAIDGAKNREYDSTEAVEEVML